MEQLNVKILRAFKTELRPNNKQKTLFAKTAGVRRFAYNWALARKISEYRSTGKSSSAIDQHNQLIALKSTEYPWMYDVSKCAPQEALRDLERAYVNFFRRVKAGEKPGFPKFKSKHLDKPRFRYNSKCAVAHGAIRLPKIGWVRLKEHGYIPITGAPEVQQLSVTVKGTGAGRWFVSVLCEVDSDYKMAKQVEKAKKTAKAAQIAPVPKVDVIGIDLGLKSFATLSDGTKYEAPKCLKKQQKRLKRFQRDVSRKVKGSNNRRKAAQKLNALHFRVACQRRDFIHKLTTTLVKTKPARKYIVEALNVKGMLRNHRLAGAIADAGWGMFTACLAYKAEWMESVVTEADTFFPSSKMCSRCHAINANLTLSDRLFVCPSCALEKDRDENAAVNLENYEKYLANGTWSPRPGSGLPQVLRKVTPAERKGSKQPRRSRNKTQALSDEHENVCDSV